MSGANSFNFMDMMNGMSKDEMIRTNERIAFENIVPNVRNEFKINDIEELANSIATVGLEQNLVVKETEQADKYLLVTGHRRLQAIKYIFDNNIKISDKIRKELEKPTCKVISKEENDIITEFRLYETNMQVRSMKDTELLPIIENYIELINRAKEQHLLVNGKEIKGKTKELLSDQFGISSRQAVKYTTVLKEENKGYKDKIINGDISVNKAYDEIQEEKRIKEKSKSTKKEKDGSLIELEQKISLKTDSNVVITDKAITFKYKGKDDLNRLLNILSLDDGYEEEMPE